MPYKDVDKQKEASKLSAKVWAKRNRLYMNEVRRKWNNNNPKNVMVAAAKQRAKKLGLDFSLTVENCPDTPEYCPILGIRLEPKREGTKGTFRGSPTLDRIDNTKGYTPDNLRVISYQANKWKSNMSIEDVERLLAYMKGEV